MEVSTYVDEKWESEMLCPVAQIRLDYTFSTNSRFELALIHPHSHSESHFCKPPPDCPSTPETWVISTEQHCILYTDGPDPSICHNILFLSLYLFVSLWYQKYKFTEYKT